MNKKIIKKLFENIILWFVAAIIVFQGTLLLLVLLSSCSPTQRLNRMQKRHPYLFDRKNDTLTVKDTVRITIPGTAVDTQMTVRDLKRDTVVIRKDYLTVKTWIRNDTVYLSAKTDTIYKEIPIEIKVPYAKYEVPHQPRDRLLWYFLFFLLGIVFLESAVLLIIYIKQKHDKRSG